MLPCPGLPKFVPDVLDIPSPVVFRLDPTPLDWKGEPVLVVSETEPVDGMLNDCEPVEERRSELKMPVPLLPKSEEVVEPASREPSFKVDVPKPAFAPVGFVPSMTSRAYVCLFCQVTA